MSYGSILSQNPPDLPLTGGTMSGNIDMNGNGITNVATPVNDGDAVNKGYLQSRVPFTVVHDVISSQKSKTVALPTADWSALYLLCIPYDWSVADYPSGAGSYFTGSQSRDLIYVYTDNSGTSDYYNGTARVAADKMSITINNRSVVIDCGILIFLF